MGHRTWRVVRTAVALAAGSAALALLLAGGQQDGSREMLRGEGRRRGRTVVLAAVKKSGKIDLGGGQSGYGPYYYGDMSQYGAWVGRDGKAPPYPTYKEMSVQQSSTLPAPSAEYIKGFNKDYDAFFNGKVYDRQTPQEAGYWPYASGGALATGDPGKAGKALRSWMKEEDGGDDGEGGGDSMGDYLDDELTGAYGTNYNDEMRFYTSAS